MSILNIINFKSVFLLSILIAFISCVEEKNTSENQLNETDAMQHLIVYQEEGRFAGWPANNGIWNWGDEILVGFVEAEHRETEGFHTYNQQTARNKYARSTDGGLIWNIEAGLWNPDQSRQTLAKNHYGWGRFGLTENPASNHVQKSTNKPN